MKFSYQHCHSLLGTSQIGTDLGYKGTAINSHSVSAKNRMTSTGPSIEVKLRLHQTLRNLKDLSYRSNLPSGSALSNLFSRTLFKSLFRSDPLCPKYFLTLFNILYYPLGSAASENIFPCFIPSLSLPHGSIGSAFSTLPISSDFSYSFRIAVLYVPLSHPHVLLVSPHNLFS